MMKLIRWAYINNLRKCMSRQKLDESVSFWHFQYQSCADLGGLENQGGTLEFLQTLDLLKTSSFTGESSPNWLSSCWDMSDSASDPGFITNPKNFKNQVFASLRDEYLKSGKLFVDPSFTADQNSIGMPADPDPKMAIKWLRPKVSLCTRANA